MNPYAAPADVVESSASGDESAGQAANLGSMPLACEFKQLRYAAIGGLSIMLLHVLIGAVCELRNSETGIVDSAICLLLYSPLPILGILLVSRVRSAAEVGLTRKRFREATLAGKSACILFGMTLLAFGLLPLFALPHVASREESLLSLTTGLACLVWLFQFPRATLTSE